MRYAVMLDFGSTYTKVACVSLAEKRLLRTGGFPSSVRTDARINLKECMDFASETIGKQNLEKALKLCSSSAAGGLRMAVIGLTERLSCVAGRNTAFGAGGKIVGTYSGKITEEDVQKLEGSKAEIILLCGGYEKGNKSIVLHNAQLIAESRIAIPIIYAGNSEVASQVRASLISHGKHCLLADNVIPGPGELNTAAAEAVVRDQFMKRIVDMKGIGCVRNEIASEIVPTPAAVLAAGTLLSQGSVTQKGFGPFMMVDVGGATTDVYSFGENKAYPGACLSGVKEPYAKRTVEGDMGMRESSICVLREVGISALAGNCAVSAEILERAIKRRVETTAYLPDSQEEQRIEQELACQAVGISVRRHAGVLENVWTTGARLMQIGKNLTECGTIIGIGGVLVNSANPEEILRRAQLAGDETEKILLPRSLDTRIDRDYVFYAAGLLRKYDEEAALSIMKNSIQ